MTFRARLVLAATAAVLVVVVLGSVATYLVAYNSLVGSIDVTLGQTSRYLVATNSISNSCGTAGNCIQGVSSSGQTNPADPSVLPVTDAVRAIAASQGAKADTLCPRPAIVWISPRHEPMSAAAETAISAARFR